MSKSLFDHLNSLTNNKDITWKKLSEDDKKTFSIYMINRFLSMNQHWVTTVNQLQSVTHNIGPELTYKLYQDLLPKKKVFLKYIKSKVNKKPNSHILIYIKQFFTCSESEAIDYYRLLTQEQVIEIIMKFGIDEKQIKKWIKANETT